jgi:hypothetical protein
VCSPRLRALILEDIGRFPDAGRAYIHRRIGPEIHEKALARALDALLRDGAIVSTGSAAGASTGWRAIRDTSHDDTGGGRTLDAQPSEFSGLS